jgi:protein TonB
MAYADQSVSGNRIVALIIVAIIHVAVGYALVTGLAYQGLKKVIERVTTVDVEEPPPPSDEPPPPPPKELPPPPVAPPPPINIAVAPPPIRTQEIIPPPPPQVIRIVPVAAPPPPPKPVQPYPEPRGRYQEWASSADYPSRALRLEEQGTTSFTVTVDTEGKVADCRITGSSGFDDLDETTCRLITRRGRFKPALDSNGNPMTGTWSRSVKWVIPKD